MHMQYIPWSLCVIANLGHCFALTCIKFSEIENTVSMPISQARRYQACNLIYETSEGEKSQTVKVPRDL